MMHMHALTLILQCKGSVQRIERRLEWPTVPRAGELIEVAPAFIASYRSIVNIRHNLSASRIEVMIEPIQNNVFDNIAKDELVWKRV
jgi:hypothetical protein